MQTWLVLEKVWAVGWMKAYLRMLAEFQGLFDPFLRSSSGMAFSTLKAQRTSKNASSFIDPIEAPIDHWGPDTSPWPREAGSYSELPNTLEIRKDAFGRGIWTKKHIARGKINLITGPFI